MPVAEGAAWKAALMFGGVVGVCVVVTVITIIIIKKRTKEKELEYKADNTVCHNGISYRYDPETKTIVESCAPATVKDEDDSNNNLRKRSPSTISAPKKEAKDSTATKEVQTEPVETVNLNDNDTKILPGKTIMPMTIEEKVNNYLSGGIPSSSSQPVTHPGPTNNLETLSNSGSTNFSSLSSEKSTDSIKKAYKKRIHKSFEKYVTDMIQKNCALQAASSNEDIETDSLSESSDISSASSNWSNISSEKSIDDFNKAYKKRIHKTLKRFVSNIGKTSRAPSECSDESEFSIISQEAEVCKTCKTNRVNSSMQPCMHRYLCSDCATKIFELYKRCKVCRAKIERIAVEE